MTDEEIICRWMEPAPQLPVLTNGTCCSCGGWWVWGGAFGAGPRWIANRPDLNRLHEVEARIIAQTSPWPSKYADWADVVDTALCNVLTGTDQYHWHATAEQKIKALAQAIREFTQVRECAEENR